MNHPNRTLQALLQSPFLWGGLLAGAFYGLISSGLLGGRLGELSDAYFASHPIEYVATIMFFVGMAALVSKALLTVVQFQGLSDRLLGPVASDKEPSAQAGELLAKLNRLPGRRQGDLLVGRLRSSLEHVRRRGTAESLDDELKYLADLDAARAHDSHALVRVIIWAIPILGFLGTVIGITLAVANLEPKALETSLPEVVDGLSVAFNTTAQALALSIVLMFSQFFVDRMETRLAARVDQRADEELMGRFEHISSTPDGQVVAVRRMAESMLASTDELVHRQTELWQQSIEEARGRWSDTAQAAGQQLQSALTEGLSESLRAHAHELAESQAATAEQNRQHQEATAEQNRQHWERVQEGLRQSTSALAALQNDLTRQAEAIRCAVEATGQIAKLEETLNRNLAALAGSKNFEQTVNSLAAAIHLLNARLGEVPSANPPVHLESDSRTGQAA